MSEWLSVLGFSMDRLLLSPITSPPLPNTALFKQSLPTISGLSCTADTIAAQFRRLSVAPPAEPHLDSVLMPSIPFRLANLPSVIGDGVLLSRSKGRAYVSSVAEASPYLREVFATVFNDTLMVDLSFSLHGQDSFFFVQEQRSKTKEDYDQLQRLGSLLNVTLQPVESTSGEPTGTGQVDLKIHSTSVILSIRYGTTMEEERKRLLRVARRRAVDEAWSLEAEQVKAGYKGSVTWSKVEKDELLATGKVSSYYGTDVFDTGKYTSLADDPTNIVFRKESSRKKRGRGRRNKS